MKEKRKMKEMRTKNEKKKMKEIKKRKRNSIKGK